MGQYVYSPLDKVSVFKHDSVEYPLVANGTSDIVSKTKGVTDSQVADYAVSKLGQWGVCKVSAPVTPTKAGKGKASNDADQELVDAAEAKYLEAMDAWSDQVILDHYSANEIRVRAGLSPKESNEYLRARKWQKDHPGKGGKKLVSPEK